MTARALQQSTGLAVDNSEAVGALSAEGLRETDLVAGRWDGARVRIWEVEWSAPDQRRLLFAGRLGEIAREGQSFRAELRGMAEALNAGRGRVIQPLCAAVLGDGQCRANLAQPGYVLERSAVAVRGDGTEIDLGPVAGVAPGWFSHGRVRVLDGTAAGLEGVVRADRLTAAGRVLALWQAIPGLAAGDPLRLEPGCDKRLETCRLKFDNVLNFRGFPDVPGEDWLAAWPRIGGVHDGGSLR
jgi:uncharacterized phage protein (TIGR02218 family)